MSDDHTSVRAAAILDDGQVDVDALLTAIADQQRHAGRRVRGLLMLPSNEPGSCATAMVLKDIASGDEYLVSQPLGSGSSACRADPQGFARASRVLRNALDQSPDLVISNRFGGLEAEGGGFTAELLELMAHDIPVLTVVAARRAPVWQQFTGGAPLLPAQAEAITAWLDRTLEPGHPAS